MKLHRSVLVIAILTACRVGGAGGFRPAQSPAGVHARVEIRGRVVQGELLEVRDTALVIGVREKFGRRDGKSCPVILIPTGLIRSTDFHQMGSNPSVHEVRRVSRFPQGLSPDLLQVLLSLCGQSEVEVAGG